MPTRRRRAGGGLEEGVQATMAGDEGAHACTQKCAFAYLPAASTICVSACLVLLLALDVAVAAAVATGVGAGSTSINSTALPVLPESDATGVCFHLAV